jgi:hypothetical protein
MDATDQDIEDDTHICLKCRTTIVGRFHHVQRQGAVVPGPKFLLTECIKISSL